MKTMILRAHTTWAAGLQQPTFSMSPSYFASSWSCCGGTQSWWGAASMRLSGNQGYQAGGGNNPLNSHGFMTMMLRGTST